MRNESRILVFRDTGSSTRLVPIAGGIDEVDQVFQLGFEIDVGYNTAARGLEADRRKIQDTLDSGRQCQLRTCCMDNSFLSCAECKDFEDINKCKKFNNIFSKFFSLIFGSDRKGCVCRIKEIGIENFAKEMAENKISNKVKK